MSKKIETMLIYGPTKYSTTSPLLVQKRDKKKLGQTYFKLIKIFVLRISSFKFSVSVLTHKNWKS